MTREFIVIGKIRWVSHIPRQVLLSYCAHASTWKYILFQSTNSLTIAENTIAYVEDRGGYDVYQMTLFGYTYFITAISDKRRVYSVRVYGILYDMKIVINETWDFAMCKRIYKFANLQFMAFIRGNRGRNSSDCRNHERANTLKTGWKLSKTLINLSFR